MSTITVSATYARNNFFDLLNRVAAGASVVIEKDTREVAVIRARPKMKTDWVALKKAAKRVHGIMPGFKLEESPLRRLGAKDFLGRWDQGI